MPPQIILNSTAVREGQVHTPLFQRKTPVCHDEPLGTINPSSCSSVVPTWS